MTLPTLEQIALAGVCLMEAAFYFVLWRLRVVLTAPPAVEEYEERDVIVEDYDYPERPAFVPTENKRAVVEYGAAVVKR